MVSHTFRQPSSARAGAASDAATRQALDSIRRIVRALRESSRLSERTVGLSAAQLFVLQRLPATGALSINELAERTFTHQSSVSVVVGKLVARKLVARQASATDARRVEIGLTAAGRLLLRQSPTAAAQDRLIAGLSLLGAQRRRALATALQGLVAAMSLTEEHPPMFFETAPSRKSLSKVRRERH